MSFIATGLGIAGLMGVEGAMGAAATVAASEALGAGVGALTNPKDRLKGALMGGVTGAVGGGIGAGLGALGGAAAGEVGGEAANAVAQTGEKAVTQAALTESPTAITSQGLGTAANAPTIGGGVAPTTVATAPEASGGFSSMMSNPIAKAAAPQVLNAAGSLMSPTPTYDKSGQEKIAGEQQQGANLAQSTYKGWAHGGSIRLENNSFIIPADVVSAIGNGSTKAGAKYLDHLFTAISAGPAPKAGSLAKQRAKERRKA